MNRTVRISLLLGVVVVVGITVIFVPAIPQDPGYHDFADQRTRYGIPNFWNVVTNISYILVGIYGIAVAARRRVAGALPELRVAYLVFFAGTALIGLGSAYYHLAPTNETLVWDRLPMASAFMAFFAIIIGEYISTDAGRRSLWPLVICGLLSVFYWAYTERLGRGDLRAYAVVQFLPALLIPLMILMFRSKFPANKYIWAILGIYVVAKLAESLDGPVYAQLGFSGHSAKHILAAAGPLIMALALLNRKTESGRRSRGPPGY